MYFARTLLQCAVLLLLALPLPTTGQTSSSTGQPDQVVLLPGQTPDTAAVGDYLSPPTTAAHPFTHLLLRYQASLPAQAELTLSVRVSADGSGWSAWRAIEHNDDLWIERDGPEVFWSEAIDVGGQARFWQVRGAMNAAPDGSRPILRQIDVNTVDTEAFAPASGPASPPNQPVGAVAKPGVTSRTAWGSPDGQGSRAPVAHYPVNHIVVHHTADSSTLYGSEPNWAARVRALWSFHTFTRGWGDIGYNYLIDPNGQIYEGRAGGDDAVAFHDTANYGSMGVALIGTYSTSPPSTASQNSLVQLMAWKAAQKRIDPLGSSYYYGCEISSYCAPFNRGAIVPNIAGHRQVTPGHTTCPGDALLSLLPGLRNRVRQLIEGSNIGDNGDLEVDELESGFARSDASWYEASCGAGGHTYYTYTTDNPGESSNSATWRPNIPRDGTYRVYAHVPQGCGLATPPYASSRATYRIRHADGDSQRTINHNGSTAWVDLGVYSFRQGRDGAVELYDLTGEPYSDRRVLFFDAIKWVAESSSTAIALLGLRFDRTSVAGGELVKAIFTVKNTGTTTIHTQSPQAGTAAGGGFNDGVAGRPDDAYVYDEGECFDGDQGLNYAAFPKETNRFRVALGPSDMSGVACVGEVGGYPWRWGLNGDLAASETREIVAYVRMRNEGTSNRTLTLRGGLIQEYVRYYAQDVQPTTITVAPERFTPSAASYDVAMNPAAQVYQLGNVPDNFLARTRNPLSLTRGEFVGTFAWDGTTIDWGGGGPLGQRDAFLIEQARTFLAPSDGLYTFRTTSDDGSWLWVDGQPVIINHGLHAEKEMSGTISLTRGVHRLSFKYFERSGYAVSGYSLRLPGGSAFISPPDSTGALRVGNTYVQHPDLTIAADDLGGTGVDHIRWRWQGTDWQDEPGSVLRLSRLQNGSYRLQYQAVDRVGNQSQLQDIAFNVNTNLQLDQTYLPVVRR